jgi:hypothetical protein
MAGGAAHCPAVGIGVSMDAKPSCRASTRRSRRTSAMGTSGRPRSKPASRSSSASRAFSNRRRRHSTLGYPSRADFGNRTLMTDGQASPLRGSYPRQEDHPDNIRGAKPPSLAVIAAPASSRTSAHCVATTRCTSQAPSRSAPARRSSSAGTTTSATPLSAPALRSRPPSDHGSVGDSDRAGGP